MHLPEKSASANHVKLWNLLLRRHWRFRMSRAWAAQQHKPGEVNPFGSSDRLEPAHRQQVLRCAAPFPRVV